MKKHRIAVFGGTFNPPHVGHFHLAAQVLKHNYADKVMFVPALLPPHKQTMSNCSSFEDRIRMLQAGIDRIGEKRFFVNDLEGKRKDRPSYTYDTMQELSDVYPDTELILLMGSDSLLTLHTWYKAEELVSRWSIKTYPRHGFNSTTELELFWPHEIALNLAGSILPLEIYDISSTEIRNMIQNGIDISDFVFPEIYEYIKKKGLFKRV